MKLDEFLAQLPKGDSCVRLRLAHVVAGLFLQPEGARTHPRLSPGALHPVDALPRHQAQARPGDGPVPRRLVLGHGVPGARRPRRALARLWRRRRCRGASTRRAWSRCESLEDAKCARSRFSPTRRIRRTCTSSTCTGVRASSRKASASAVPRSTTSAIRWSTCASSRQPTRTSNGSCMRRSCSAPMVPARWSRPRGRKCSRRSASPRLPRRATFYRGAHPGERLGEPGALCREVEAREMPGALNCGPGESATPD